MVDWSGGLSTGAEGGGLEWRVKYRSEWVVERVGGGLEWSVVECGGLEWTGFKFRSGGGWIGVEG